MWTGGENGGRILQRISDRVCATRWNFQDFKKRQAHGNGQFVGRCPIDDRSSRKLSHVTAASGLERTCDRRGRDQSMTNDTRVFNRTAFVPRLPEYVVQSAAKLPKKVLRRVKFRASRRALTAAARYGSAQRRRGSPL